MTLTRKRDSRGRFVATRRGYRIPELDVRLLAIRDDIATPEDRLRFAVRGECAGSEQSNAEDPHTHVKSLGVFAG